MLSLTSLTAPLAARTAFSSIGVNCRQGPHHGAQKSTRTGTSREASTTSRMKSLVVVFLIRSASAATPPSERIGGSMLIHPGFANPIRLACQRQGGRISWERWAAKGGLATAPGGFRRGRRREAHG